MNFSVVIANYNYREYVVEAIESALQQTLPPHEVVIVDDGSTDGSADLLQTHYGTRPTVKLIRTENRGQLAALIEGFRAASGDTIALLDADDLYEPVYLERLAREYEARPHVDFIAVNMRMFGAGDGLWFGASRDLDWGTSALKVWNSQIYEGAPTSGNSLRRAVCAKALSLPPEFAADWRTRADDCVVMGAALWGACKLYLAEPLVRYRVHDRNRWLKRTEPRVGQVRHALRAVRMVEWHATQAGVTARALHFAHLEFKTRQRPTLREFCFYVSLSNSAPAAVTHKVWAALSMLKHYVRSLLD